MAYIIGIDTGGTYTDAVLLDTENGHILAKAKAFTTKEDLSVGIKGSLRGLGTLPQKIEKVVLSTTLATNAVVEDELAPVGALYIGKAPRGEFPNIPFEILRGKINVKGREEVRLDEDEIHSALDRLLPKVSAVAVIGYMSVRNPLHELKVKEMVREHGSLPVVCGHELSGSLGFKERAATAILNAALLPVIAGFLDSMERVLRELSVNAPVFVVRGDGTMAELDYIRNRPAETILSGPATSIIGAKYLTGVSSALISDMGGTTTDTAVLEHGTVCLSDSGAVVGPWRTHIPSAELHTCGIGGDSAITFDGELRVGPKRALPVCRGGTILTPTDLLHCFGDFVRWDEKAARKGAEDFAEKIGISTEHLLDITKRGVLDGLASALPLEKSLPVIAIGAPVGYWFLEAKKRFGFELVIPEHHEVANAVGAAAAEWKERVFALVRPGEDGHGYLAHTPTARYAFREKEDAVKKAIAAAKEAAEQRLKIQGAVRMESVVERRDIMEKSCGTYMETRITVTSTGYLI